VQQVAVSGVVGQVRSQDIAEEIRNEDELVPDPGEMKKRGKKDNRWV
jgi:hypothetical protein